MDRKKILMDTDIGDDIDDALALVLALKIPEAELIGVTTVFKDTDIRAREARRILLQENRKIPVYAGLSGSFGSTREGFSQYEPELDSSEYMPDNDYKTDGGGGAVDFILDCVAKYGNDLTIVALGPLTNVAAAIAKDEETMKKVGKISLMGGSFYSLLNEWNFLCDTEAADLVLHSRLNVECYGIDVTKKLQLTGCQFKRIVSYEGESESLRYLARLSRMWNTFTGCIPMLHDPLALYCALDPQYVLLEEQAVELVCEGALKGVVLNRDRSTFYFGDKLKLPRVKVAKEVLDRDFLEKFFEILYGKEVLR